MKYLKHTANITFDAARCSGCGRCAEVCPHGVFVLENRKARILDRDRCMECGACSSNCPSDAIHVRRGVGCAAALIGSMKTGGAPECGCGSGTDCCG